MAAPKALGRFVFERYGLAVEILSLLLLIGLMAAIHLGRGRQAREEEDS
jgi:NADH-quinone oxidoreductase subunit J